MSVAAFLAVAALILAIMGLVSKPKWPWATDVAVLLLALAVIIMGFGGRMPFGG
jgi:hypothetical protein